MYRDINRSDAPWKMGMPTELNCRTIARQPYDHGPQQQYTPLVHLSAADVRAAYMFPWRRQGMIYLIPLAWRLTSQPAGVWPREGPHTERVRVLDFIEMLRLNGNQGYDFCFCTHCVLGKVARLHQNEGRVVSIPIHPNRDPDLAVHMLRAYCTHFNTPARMDGVYAEARRQYHNQDGSIERMMANPIRSTVWMEVTVFNALEIVVNFDPRISSLGAAIRGMPPLLLLDLVMNTFIHEIYFCPEYWDTRF
jgi:hypothetical protein